MVRLQPIFWAVRCALHTLQELRKARTTHPTFNYFLADDNASSNQARTEGENGRLSAIVSAQLV